jgi:NAD dependent epimerase/dehydratase family enzyme
MNTRRVILAGGSGFLGTIMAGHFRAQGCETVVLTRSPNEPPIPGSAREAFWDGHTLG